MDIGRATNWLNGKQAKGEEIMLDKSTITRRAFVQGAASAAAITMAVAGCRNLPKSDVAGSLADAVSLPHEELGTMTAEAIARRYRSGELSPVEVATATLDRIEAANDYLHAFVHIAREPALAQARESEGRWRDGAPLSSLDGVPVSLKEGFKVAGMPQGFAGSMLNEEEAGKIEEMDEPAIANLRKAGMVFTGKTAMSELGSWATSMTTAYPLARNPWDLSKTPGGSSSGAGAAASAGLGPLHLGSDGGGSVRIPASYCGVFGHKSSAFRAPSVGHPELVYGPLARSVRDAAMMMTALTRPIAGAPRLLPSETDDYAADLDGGDVDRWNIAYQPYSGHGMRSDNTVLPVVQKAVAALRKSGLTISDLEPTLPGREQDGTLAERISQAEDIVAEYGADFTMLKRKMTPSLYAYTVGILEQGGDIEAIKERGDAVWDRLEAAAHADPALDNDILLSFTMPNKTIGLRDVVPPELQPIADEQGTAYDNIDRLYVANLSGAPAASIPCGLAPDGMPVGLSITAKPGEDLKVLQMAARVEQIFERSGIWTA